MEAKDMGLTKEEKIMFSILGIVLIIAIGVLIINGFSNNERELVEETPTKNVEQSEEFTNDTKNEETLKESETINVVSNNTTHKKVTYLSHTTEDKKEEKKPTLWVVNDNIITKAYSGDEIIIDDTVIESDNKKVSAAVTVRKLENNTYSIVDITNNRFVATKGTYIYYYTHDSVTKEIMLIVYDKINLTSLSVSELSDEEKYIFNDEEFALLKENNENSKVEFEEQYTLTLTKKSDYSKVALTLTTDFIVYSFEMNTKGIQVLDIKTDEESKESNIILIVDTSILEDIQDINLAMNDEMYSFKLETIIEEYKGEEPSEEDNSEEQDSEKDKEDDKEDKGELVNQDTEEDEGELNNQEKEDEGELNNQEEQKSGEELQPEIPDVEETNNNEEILEESLIGEILTNIETPLQVLAE